MAKRNQLKDKILGKHRPAPKQPTCYRSPQRQSKGTLRAKYGEQTKVWRIAYVANGFWQLQRYVADDNFPDRRVCDPWSAYARPTSFENAMSQMQRKDQMQQVAA